MMGRWVVVITDPVVGIGIAVGIVSSVDGDEGIVVEG